MTQSCRKSILGEVARWMVRRDGPTVYVSHRAKGCIRRQAHQGRRGYRFVVAGQPAQPGKSAWQVDAQVANSAGRDHGGQDNGSRIEKRAKEKGHPIQTVRSTTIVVEGNRIRCRCRRRRRFRGPREGPRRARTQKTPIDHNHHTTTQQGSAPGNEAGAGKRTKERNSLLCADKRNKKDPQPIRRKTRKGRTVAAVTKGRRERGGS